MDCQLDAVFEAKAGREVPADVRMVSPPANLDGRARPRASGKAIYGNSLSNHVDTDNFTVQWDDPLVDTARAEEIAVRLEDGWRVFVEEGGWTAPVSSDTYLVWVILDTTVPGSGYTTTYSTDAYPDGYPVIYLQPLYDPSEEAGIYPGFALSVAVHEFAHTLQLALREHAEDETRWYWEATAEWAAELGAPDIDTYAQSSYWYARSPEFSYDSLYNAHNYGMFLLNMYLEERVFGTDGIRDVWLAGGEDPDATWDTLIADVAGQDFGEMVTAFTGEYAALTLRESSLYYQPLTPLTYADGDGWVEEDLPDPYGTWYVNVAEIPEGFTVEGPVGVAWAVPGVGWSTSAPENGPAVLAITATGEGDGVAWGVPPEGEDTAVPGDSDDVVDPQDTGKATDPEDCGCPAGGSVGWSGLFMGVATLGRRRLG